MNTTFTPAAPTRLASLALSAFFTLSMLAGINSLARNDDNMAALMAQHQAQQAHQAQASTSRT